MPEDHSPAEAPDATPSDPDVPREQPYLLAVFVSLLSGMTLGFIGYSIPELGTACLILFALLTGVAFLVAWLASRGGHTRVLPPFEPDEPPAPPPGVE